MNQVQTGKRMWQIASGSITAHVIDTDKPAWKNPDGSRRLSGPRALCGRYPQRNADGVWFETPVTHSEALSALQHYHSKVCEDCGEALAEDGS